MKNFKRILSILLALLTVAMLFACSAAPNHAGDMEPGGFLDGMSGNSMGVVQNNQSSIGGTNNGGSDDSVEGMPAPSVPDAGDPGEDSEDAPAETTSQDPEDVEEGVGDDPQPSNPSLITAPFVSVADMPFSTFSADVDTASYTYFRKLVCYGYKINELRNVGSQLRVEEFINYFRYDAKSPTENELFGVTTTLVQCPWDETSLLLRATLQTETPVTQAPNNLVFLIDVSGSMSSSDKLPLLKKAFSYLVGNLNPTDTVSIVTYSGKEAVVLDGATGSNPTQIMNAINSLVASGSTNGEAGLTMAYQIAEKHMKEGSNNRIIMASDGDLNVGISSADELKRYIEQKRDAGIYLSVLGFGGGNYRDANMEALADNGNGVYYYIDGESEAEKVFGTDLTGTLYTVANDVKLQIEFNPANVESYRLIGYDNRVLDKEDFEDDTKDAGEVGASHQVTVCYEIKLKANPTSSDSGNYLTIRVRYKNPGEPLSRLNEYNVGAGDFAAEADQDTRFVASVIELVSFLRNPLYDGDITLNSIFYDLQGLNLTDPYRIEFRELVRSLITE